MEVSISEPRERGEKLAVIVPARDEVDGLADCVEALLRVLNAAAIRHELLIVDDHSVDGTSELAERISNAHPTVRYTRNELSAGIGNAIAWGIHAAAGDRIAIVMADGSDSPDDLVRYCKILDQGVDCAFGSRFEAGSKLSGYPPLKLLLNRAGNRLVALLFRIDYNDCTNAFKAYPAALLKGLLPLRSSGFEVTLELPLRSLAAGASHMVVPISWRGRSAGSSKMRLLFAAVAYLKTLIGLRITLGGAGGFRRDGVPNSSASSPEPQR